MDESQVIKIGQIIMAPLGQTLVCKGLGSCIGLFLYDEKLKLAGGAHIMLPEIKYDQDINNTKYAWPAIKHLILQFKIRGSHLQNLSAKLVGGAKVITCDPFQIGQRNYDSVKRILSLYHIPILGEDVGQNTSRSAYFSSHTGQLKVVQGAHAPIYV